MAFRLRERKGALRLAALLGVAVLTNCSGSTDTTVSGSAGMAGAGGAAAIAGKERGPCYGNGTCNAGTASSCQFNLLCQNATSCFADCLTGGNPDDNKCAEQQQYPRAAVR